MKRKKEIKKRKKEGNKGRIKREGREKERWNWRNKEKHKIVNK